MSSGPYTIVQLARAAHVDSAEIKLLQEMKLLQPPRRVSGRPLGRMAYHQEHVDRLIFIARARRLGFSFEDIGRILDPDNLVTCADVYRLADECVRRSTEMNGGDASSTDELLRLMEGCSRTGSQNDCSILSALRAAESRDAARDLEARRPRGRPPRTRRTAS
jgi:DNA-binding transcriptional MerR regulator